MVPEAIDAMKKADVILALDWVDLGGGLRQAFGHEAPKAKIINVSADFHIHNGWSMDYEMLPPVDLLLPATPDEVVRKLLAALGGAKAPKSVTAAAKPEKYEPSGGPLRVDDLARSLKAAVGNRSVTLTHLAAVLERSHVAIPPPARLHRLGRRRRRRRRAWHFGRRGAGAQRLRPLADRDLR